MNDVNYCLSCGAHLSQKEASGRIRPVCENCGWIYFPDPKVAVAGLISEGNKILLVRRAVDPYRGKWTLPAGFVDAGEDPVKAIVRECLEETGLNVEVESLVDVIYGQEHTKGAHIVIVYRAKVLSGSLKSGDDVDRVKYFHLDKLPRTAFKATEKIVELLRNAG